MRKQPSPGRRPGTRLLALAVSWLLPCGALVAGPGPVPPVRTEPVSILWEEGVKNAYPHWSRDGSRILYQSNRGGAWQLHVMDRDGSHAEALTEGSSNSNFPDWSPDNRAIAFVSDRDFFNDIYVADAVDGEHADKVIKGERSETFESLRFLRVGMR